MDTPQELKIIILDPSITEATTLMTLLSPLSRDVSICARYSQGMTVLQYALDNLSPFDLVFLAFPPDHHPEIEAAVKCLSLALRQNPAPHRTIIMGGDTFPPSFIQDLTRDSTVLYKPITRDKLQQALEPLAISLPRLNCWEYMRCGREPGGRRVAELGVCPVPEAQNAHGLHGGHDGGRACWAIAGTLCGGKVQGTFANKIKNCQECDFYHLVQVEEGDRFASIDSILNQLRRKSGGKV